MVGTLGHKLARDLWRIKGQATAIALVMATGVMMLVMTSGLVNSLEETRRAYYERYRLADVFAPLVRAPIPVAAKLAEIPGVTSVTTRVVGRATVELDGESLPVQAVALSLPTSGAPRLNAVRISAGRALAGTHRDEILLLDAFAKAHEIRPGDRIRATLNGKRRTLRVVGLAQSPEFLYTTAPGELVPDDARFAAIWMNRESMAAHFGMQGAFNEALIGLSRNAREPDVLRRVDLILERYGGAGAYGLSEQMSNRFISEEIGGLRSANNSVPPFFLAVAAFLLYMIINRMITAEREQIGILKAFGYTNGEVSGHYFQFVLLIALFGAALGCVLGIIAGRALIQVYAIYYKFPFLVFRLDPASFVVGVSVSIAAASAGGFFVLRRIFALSPAEAMRPPTPPDFSGTFRLQGRLGSVLDAPTRMVLRRFSRHPGRMVGSIAGLAAGMALTVAQLSIYSGFDRTIEVVFGIADRSDLSVSFNHPQSSAAAFEISRLPGVMAVEPVRHVPVILHSGTATHRGAISGLVLDPRLFRALDRNLQPIPLPENGVVISVGLAAKLGVAAGDVIFADVREGRRPKLALPVSAVAQSYLGSPAYMRLEALNRALREPGRMSAVHLEIDTAKAKQVYSALRDRPGVAGTSVTRDAERTLQKIMDSGAGATRFIFGAIAFVVTFGVIYNASRIAQSESGRDLASLRVLGYTRGETAFVLFGELGLVTLIAMPVGTLLGYAFSFGIAAAYSTDLYQIPAVLSPHAVGDTMLFMLAALVVSMLAIKRDIDRTDLVAALKARE